MTLNLKVALAALGGALTMVAAQADDGTRFADGIGFYVGIDTRLVLPSGTYAGLPNPNAGRLSLLFDHGDHYHGIGNYSLSGPAGAPVVESTNANNRIPELYARVGGDTDAIPLQPGTGSFAGGYASQVLPDSAATHAYSHLGIASVQSLSGLSPTAEVLYHSSADRWSAGYQNLNVGLKLLSATPGLKVAANGMLDIFAAGDTYALGSSQTLEFLPTYYVGADAAPGTYSASFMLVAGGSNANAYDSGSFHFDFSVPTPVPEPQSWALFGAGLLGLGWVGRRRRGQGSAQP